MPNNTIFPPEPPKTEQPWTPRDVIGYTTPSDVLGLITENAMGSADKITGFDKSKTQLLTNVNGVIKWVDAPAE